MNYKYRIYHFFFVILWLLSLACQGNYKKAPSGGKMEQVRQAKVTEFKGRIYLGGSEVSEFIALQTDSTHSYYLIGADSLRRYQDYFALVKGWLAHPASDSIFVVKVKLLQR